MTIRGALSSRRLAHKLDTALPPIIAVVGCDGAGKSTLCEALLAWLSQARPAELCHLGKQTGDLRRALIKVPVIGARAGHSIRSRSDRVRSSVGPDALTALATYLISMRRVRRFRRMLRLQRRGITIVADRYPQLAIPGPRMDGPHLVVSNPRNRVARLLTARELDHYRRMVDYLPDLVIRLNVDHETACRRKPDHNPASLAEKIGVTSLLRYNGAPIVDIDAGLPLATVIGEAQRAVVEVLSRHPSCAGSTMLPAADASRTPNGAAQSVAHA